jgi:cell division inhibitor SulA
VPRRSGSPVLSRRPGSAARIGRAAELSHGALRTEHKGLGLVLGMLAPKKRTPATRDLVSLAAALGAAKSLIRPLPDGKHQLEQVASMKRSTG